MDNSHLERLARVRSSKKYWDEIRFLEGRLTSNEIEDVNYSSRYGVLVALQYDLRLDDHELVYYLLEQECLASESPCVQGLPESLRLSCYLLSTFKQKSDVWLFWRAKQASFDTECGLDFEFILSPGVEATKEYVRASQHPQATALLAYLSEDGRAAITESDLESWRLTMQDWFPTVESAEDLLSLVGRDIVLGDRDNAKKVLGEWEESQPRTKATLEQLAYYLTELKEFHRAVTIEEELLRGIHDEPWESVSQRTSLALCLLQCARHDDALRILKECDSDLAIIKDWKKYGLGRAMIEAALDVGLHPSSSKNTATAALLWADNHLTSGCSYSPNIIEKIVKLAKLVSNTNLERHYSKQPLQSP